MRKLNKVSIKRNENVMEVMTRILSSIFPHRGEISFHKVNIYDFVKSELFRKRFSEHSIYMYGDNEKYVAKYLMNSTTFDKRDFILTTSLSGFNVTGKFSFMGEVSRFYIPAGLVYSIINNRVESAIPKEIVNLIAIVDTPAVVVFDIGGGYSGSNGKFYIESLTYLFKESGKYLTVTPFNGLIFSNTPQAKSTVLRFFEFFLNLAQFFNENEKVTPFCYDVIRPDLLTEPMLEEYMGRRHPYDPAHEHGVRIIGAVSTAINEHIVNKINEAYSKARNSFSFLGQDPIEALENFNFIVKIAG
jgi:hypothetical protein